MNTGMAHSSVASTLHLLGVILFLFSFIPASSASSIPSEPHRQIHSFNSTALPPQTLSPDPLVRYYKWSDDINQSELQIYSSHPVKWQAQPPTSFRIITTAPTSRDAGKTNDAVHVEVTGVAVP
jgi:hypothetical protein